MVWMAATVVGRSLDTFSIILVKVQSYKRNTLDTSSIILVIRQWHSYKRNAIVEEYPLTNEDWIWGTLKIVLAGNLCQFPQCFSLHNVKLAHNVSWSKCWNWYSLTLKYTPGQLKHRTMETWKQPQENVFMMKGFWQTDAKQYFLTRWCCLSIRLLPLLCILTIYLLEIEIWWSEWFWYLWLCLY